MHLHVWHIFTTRYIKKFLRFVFFPLGGAFVLICPTAYLKHLLFSFPDSFLQSYADP